MVNFITLGFLARVLAPDQLGYYNAVQNSGNYINMMSSLGTLIVIQRTGARIRELGEKAVSDIFSNAFTMYLIINFLAGAAILIFPQYFFDFLLDSKGDLNVMAYISVLILLNALGQIPLYLIQGLEEFKMFSIRNLLGTLVTLLVTVFFVVLLSDDLKASYLGLIFSYLINAILTGYLLQRTVKKFGLFIRIKMNFKVIKSLMAEGFIYYFGNTFLGAISGLITISLFFKYLSSFDYGFTRIGYTFALMLSIIPAAIQPVTISMLSMKHERNTYLKSLQLRIIPFFSALAFVVVAFNLEFFVKIFFGNDYLGARDIVFAMMLIQVPNIYLGLLNNYQTGAGHLNYVGTIGIIGSLMMIGLAFWLVPLYGMKGYFASFYTPTLFALGLLTFREYFQQSKLTHADIYSALIVLVILILSYFIFNYVDPIIRVPLTGVVVLTAAWLFWKYCMDGSEKSLLLREAHRVKLLYR